MVSQVTVANKVPLYKGEEPANSIELLQFEEVDFEVVRQKDLNQIGDKLLLVYPDWCIPDNQLFKEYWYPGGDASKSKLGKQGRVRAVKFNLHRGDGQPVYSNGIVLTVKEISDWIARTPTTDAWGKFLYEITDEDLGITKYEEPEANGRNLKAGSSCPFPSDLYKTDEPNILTIKNLPFPARYVVRDKEDGSSITLWVKNGKSGICSRNLSKPLTERFVSHKRQPAFWERVKMFFLFTVDLRVWQERPAENDFVRIGLPYLNKLIEYCEQYNTNLVLRGELSGKGLNGSGNKNNRLKEANQDIRFFGLDSYGTTAKRYHDDTFREVATALNLPVCQLAFDRVFESREDLINTIQEYFSQNKNLEGVVCRTGESSELSAKVINLHYDSLK
mgnify:FL=1